MNSIKRQSGFSVVELVIILAVIGALGFIGYSIYSRQTDTTKSSQNPVASGVPEAPVIKSTRDLDQAEKTLNAVDIDNSSDSSQLDAELAEF